MMDAPTVTFAEAPAPGFLQGPPLPPFRVPPGGRGYANAGVMAVVLPHATPAHMADMARLLTQGPPA